LLLLLTLKFPDVVADGDGENADTKLLLDVTDAVDGDVRGSAFMGFS
jgi:hypothetical protein